MKNTVSCSVTIHRSSPDSMGASVSTRGHETGPRFWSTDTDRTTVDSWIAANAPEINLSQPHRPVFDFGIDGETRDFYFLTGKDTRGYFTEVYVQFYYPETVKVIHPGPALLADGSTIMVDRVLISY